MTGAPTLLQSLAAWGAAIRYESLPPQAATVAKRCFLDYIGAALSAPEFGTESTRAGAMQILAFLSAEGQTGDALLIGSEQRLSASAAALMNSYLGQSTSLDDTALRSMSHPGCAVVPAILACAGPCKASGEDVIAAIVFGYEAMIRVGRGIMPGHAKRGFHVTATTAPFGAAAAAARLMRLDTTQTLSALAIAGDLGAGLQEALFRSYAAGKLAVARSVQAGVMAARLAADGMPGAPAFLEGEEGFLRAMTDEAHPDLVCAGLGQTFEIEHIGFKFHSGCRHWHAAVDGVVALRKAHGLTARDVESIHFRTYSEALRMNIDAPPSGDQARLSTPFAVAQALLGRDLVTGDLFCDAELFRPEVQDVMRRVSHSFEPSFERRYPMEWPVALEVRLRDGRCLTAARDQPNGEPGTIDDRAIADKFLVLSARAFDSASARHFIEQVDAMERLPSLAPLTATLERAKTDRIRVGKGQAA